jgi:hypothetical protein
MIPTAILVLLTSVRSRQEGDIKDTELAFMSGRLLLVVDGAVNIIFLCHQSPEPEPDQLIVRKILSQQTRASLSTEKCSTPIIHQYYYVGTGMII